MDIERGDLRLDTGLHQSWENLVIESQPFWHGAGANSPLIDYGAISCLSEFAVPENPFLELTLRYNDADYVDPLDMLAELRG